LLWNRAATSSSSSAAERRPVEVPGRDVDLDLRRRRGDLAPRQLDQRETGLGIPSGSMSGQQRSLGAFDVSLSKSDPSELGEGPPQLASQVRA
jgi:hypothetical protein